MLRLDNALPKLCERCSLDDIVANGSWLGLVPKQYSTGGKTKPLGITKRGNRYLRTMFVHGARAVLLRVKYDTGGFGQWLHRLLVRAPRNKRTR
jgi:transposase